MIESTDVPSVYSPRIFANSPSSEEMFSITRLADIYWIGGSDWVDRYDSTINQWIQPISTGEEGLAITTDGLNIYLGTLDSGMMVYGISNWSTFLKTKLWDFSSISEIDF